MKWNCQTLTLVLSGFCVFACADEPVVNHQNPLKQFLFDTRIIAETNNVRLVLGRVEKDSHNPLIKADKPWENALNNLYPNIIYDGQFKLWYKCVLADSNIIARMMPPRTINNVGWFLCYATSADGIMWEKPVLNLHGFDGSKKNNVVARDVANVGVFRDPHDSNPARRYKMIYDIGVRLPDNMREQFSPDGINWSEPLHPEGLGTSGDTHSMMFWDEQYGRYVLISRIYLGERLVARAESLDAVHWTKPEVVLRSLPNEGKNRQTYCMPVFPYANIYLGFVMMYNIGSDKSVDCELVWSPDSVKWERVLAGTPFIPRGPSGSYDAGCIYAQAGPPILKDGYLWIYYGGSTAVHRGWKRNCLPCLVRLRPDGFAGYESQQPHREGSIITKPLYFMADQLRVSADASGGSLRVEIVDINGFSLDDCEPITSDVTDCIVKWKSGKTPGMLKGKLARIKFVLCNARIYTFSGMEPGENRQ
ncbi:MAG: hypothetical protein PHR77_06735 [Kiritimatiellae bacterium]|nr:hypothetical protein [Kiritimatiellia bacterium]MDD5521966.1 hypothetical protein [Kiritimatiellia bacterium]